MFNGLSFFVTTRYKWNKSYELEVSFNRYSDIYLIILKLNYIPYKIHKYVNFKKFIAKVLRP